MGAPDHATTANRKPAAKRGNSGHRSMADALTGLYRQLQGRALFLTQNREAANELVQGVCERALRKQSMFAPGTNLEAWLRRVMRNLYIDELRRRHLCVPLPCEPQTEATGDELTCPLDLL